MRLSLRLPSMACFVLALSCAVVSAQSTAQLNGRVEDQSGARLPGVEITATQTDTGIARTAVTNETGNYILPNLPIGPYRLEAVLPGFRTFVQTGIVLQVNSSPTVNVVLEIGQVAEQIEVTANAALVETRNLGIGQIVENQRILDLPLDGRQVTQLILLAGGAVQTELGSPHRQPKGAVEMKVAGGDDGSTLYSLDGSIHVDPHQLNNLPFPFPDALQEFKVESGATSPASGVFSGAWVNAVTKSGTNEFHGSAFEFLRNDAFNARNYFAVSDSSLKRNQFGGTVGGPIVGNRLFFFAGFQRETVRTDPADFVKRILNRDMIKGDFSTFMSSKCRSTPRLLNQTLFDENNRVRPGVQVSRAVQNLLNRSDWPDELADECGVIRYGQRTITNTNQFITRVDYQINDTHSLFGRYLGDFYNKPGAYELEGRVNILHNERSGEGYDNSANSYSVGLTSLFGSNTVNSFRMGVNRHGIVRFVSDVYVPPDLGANMYWYNPGFPGSKSFKWDNPEFDLGARTGPITTYTYTIGDEMSYLRGDHEFLFGATFSHWKNYSRANAHSGGSFTTDNWYTGEVLSDFLFGAIDTFRQSIPNRDDVSQHMLGVFFSDTWQAKPNLTLNLGVRWEPRIQLVQREGNNVNWIEERYLAEQSSDIFVNAPYGLVFPGDDLYVGGKCRDSGVCTGKGMKDRWNQFAPRVGFAWDVEGDGRMALRGGVGTAYDVLAMSTHIGEQMAPWEPDIRQSRVFFDDPWVGFPGGNPFPTPVVTNFYTDVEFVSGNYVGLQADSKSETKYLWNLSLQRQIGSDMMVEATYIGNRTVHIWTNREINPTLYVPGESTSRNLDARRLWNLAHPDRDPVKAMRFSPITYRAPTDSASYNGMILRFERRPVSGVAFNANYTWSHGIETSWGNYERIGGNVPEAAVNPFVREVVKGNSEADRRHIVNLSVIAETPQFANTTLRRMASNWKASFLYRVQSGEWLTIDGGRDSMLDGGRERGIQLLENVYGDRSTRSSGYFNVDAFKGPSTGTYGNMGPHNVEGPGTWQLDMALARTFLLRETQNLEFRAEAFNLTNSFRPLNPRTRVGASSFGVIDQARDPRILQFALKYIF